jgi:hypothetical protein
LPLCAGSPCSATSHSRAAVQIDSLALQMRPRAPHEAADLGVRLCQAAAGAVYRCYLVAAIPLALLSLSLLEIAPWLPILVMWWAKPWLDRTVLFVLARAAFGQSTMVRDLWNEQRQVWWRRFLLSWTLRRLSLWRSLTEPVYQLEGHRLSQLRRRVSQLRRRHAGAAYMVTLASLFAQLGLFVALLSLVVWFTPPGWDIDPEALFTGDTHLVAQAVVSIAYIVSVLLIEPFYVAAGFGMYLNRRTELEAWDIEQEFRRAFTS